MEAFSTYGGWPVPGAQQAEKRISARQTQEMSRSIAALFSRLQRKAIKGRPDGWFTYLIPAGLKWILACRTDSVGNTGLSEVIGFFLARTGSSGPVSGKWPDRRG